MTPATFLGSSGAQNPLSFASVGAKEPLNRRPLFALGAMLLMSFTGWSVYRLSSPTVSVTRPIAVEGTGEPSDASARASGAQPRQGPDSRRLWNVVADSTGGVADTANALDAPDGRVAVIAPGGSLALASTQGPFYSGDGASIRVHGPQGQRVPYAIFARSGPERPWRQFGVNRNGLPAGVAVHDFGRQTIENAQQILLRNEGASPLYIDGVAPVYRR